MNRSETYELQRLDDDLNWCSILVRHTKEEVVDFANTCYTHLGHRNLRIVKTIKEELECPIETKNE